MQPMMQVKLNLTADANWRSRNLAYIQRLYLRTARAAYIVRVRACDTLGRLQAVREAEKIISDQSIVVEIVR